ncbi:MAG: hypothetical protein K2Y37_22440 [Pirellulales bacterium]|nr:hypothetical protein [Pirellulales bacterium]
MQPTQRQEPPPDPLHHGATSRYDPAHDPVRPGPWPRCDLPPGERVSSDADPWRRLEQFDRDLADALEDAQYEFDATWPAADRRGPRRQDEHDDH